MAGRGRQGVSFSKPSEPNFIRRFKERVGYQEGPDINTKRVEEKPQEEEDEACVDRADEKPTVVVLGEGDLTQEEADRWMVEKEKRDEDTAVAKGKITFQKPGKRSAEKSDLNCSTTKKRKDDKQEKKSHMKKVKNSSLLSFGDEEAEEEDG